MNKKILLNILQLGMWFPVIGLVASNYISWTHPFFYIGVGLVSGLLYVYLGFYKKSRSD